MASKKRDPDDSKETQPVKQKARPVTPAAPRNACTNQQDVQATQTPAEAAHADTQQDNEHKDSNVHAKQQPQPPPKHMQQPARPPTPPQHHQPPAPPLPPLPPPPLSEHPDFFKPKQPAHPFTPLPPPPHTEHPDVKAKQAAASAPQQPQHQPQAQSQIPLQPGFGCLQQPQQNTTPAMAATDASPSLMQGLLHAGLNVQAQPAHVPQAPLPSPFIPPFPPIPPTIPGQPFIPAHMMFQPVNPAWMQQPHAATYGPNPPVSYQPVHSVQQPEVFPNPPVSYQPVHNVQQPEGYPNPPVSYQPAHNAQQLEVSAYVQPNTSTTPRKSVARPSMAPRLRVRADLWMHSSKGLQGRHASI